MGVSDIIQTVATLLGGGLIATLINYKTNKSKQSSTDFKLVIDDRKDFAKDLLERMAAMEKIIEELREDKQRQAAEIHGLRMQILMVEGSHTDVPLPIWLKDTEGKVLFINDYYEDLFLKPRGYNMHDYLGKTDYNVWSKDVADSFRLNDDLIVTNRISSRYLEEIDLANGKLFIEVLKFPRFYRNEIIGVGGIVLNTAKTREELCK
jgi:hypothetical protein